METPNLEIGSGKTREPVLISESTPGSMDTYKNMLDESQPIGADCSVEGVDSLGTPTAVELSRVQAQWLMDQLWDAGVRPTPEWQRRTIERDGFRWVRPETVTPVSQEYFGESSAGYNYGPVESSDEHA